MKWLCKMLGHKHGGRARGYSLTTGVRVKCDRAGCDHSSLLIDTWDGKPVAARDDMDRDADASRP